jgi:exosortase
MTILTGTGMTTSPLPQEFAAGTGTGGATFAEFARGRLWLWVALLSWLAATGPAWWGMMQDWWYDSNYSHGLLVIPMALFFLWRGRSAWLSAPRRVSTLGMLAFAGAALLYLFGTAAAEHFSTRVAAVGGVGALAWGLLGWRFVRAAWFPLVFLFFAVPWPYVIYYQVTFPLQLFSTRSACVVLDWFGITFARQGNIIHLPGYSLEVVEACSGVRSLLSLTTLGAAYAYLTQPGIWRPWLLFILSGPIALGANILRLVITALGVYAWGPAIAEDFLHELGGLIVFAVALGALILTGLCISWISRKSQPALP